MVSHVSRSSISGSSVGILLRGFEIALLISQQAKLFIVPSKVSGRQALVSVDFRRRQYPTAAFHSWGDARRSAAEYCLHLRLLGAAGTDSTRTYEARPRQLPSEEGPILDAPKDVSTKCA